MLKNHISKIVCLFFFVSVIVCGCSLTNLNKYNKNLNEYKIEIEYSHENKVLNATQEINYINKTEIVLNQVDFHLYPNAFKNRETSEPVVSDFNFDKAYPNGFDSGYIDVFSVSIDNLSVDFSLQSNENSILTVPLKEKLYPNERVQITMEYEVKIPNIHHRFGYGDNTINVGNFYPIACVYENGSFNHDGYHYNGDPFYSEMANYKVSITYPQSLKMASTGQVERTTIIGEMVTDEITAEVVRDFAFVFSDNFSVLSEQFEDTTILYYYYDDNESTKTMQLIKDALHTFNSLIGKYPYSTLSVVKSNFIHGGMEYPNIVLISDDLQSQTDYYNVIVHEIAHQWFYNLIGNNEVSDAWLDEGLTEYVTIMFYDLNEGYGTTYDEQISSRLSSYLLFVDVYTDLFGEIDTSMNRSLREFSSEYEYTYLVYVKSVLMLDNIRNILGDANFCLGIKTYYENNKFKIAKKENFIRDFNKVSHTNIEEIVNSWLTGKVEIKK